MRKNDNLYKYWWHHIELPDHMHVAAVLPIEWFQQLSPDELVKIQQGGLSPLPPPVHTFKIWLNSLDWSADFPRQKYGIVELKSSGRPGTLKITKERVCTPGLGATSCAISQEELEAVRKAITDRMPSGGRGSYPFEFN
jgi:hypothetical protein